MEADLARANESLANAQQTLVTVEAERDQLKASVEATHAALAQAQSQGATAERLEAKIVTLETQYGALKADLQVTLSDLERAERQLATQGEEVRRLQSELTDTERFAAVLIAQREAPRSSVDDHLGQQGSTCTSASVVAPASVEVSSPATITNETRSASGVVSADDVAPHDSPSLEATQSLPPATTTNAELEATVQALRWTIEELEQRLEAKTQEEALLARLHAAQQQLQRQAVLLRQYENKGDAAPSGH